MYRDYITDILMMLWIVCNRGIDFLITVYGLSIGYVEAEPITKYLIDLYGLWTGSYLAFITSLSIMIIFYLLITILARHEAILRYNIYIRIGFLSILLIISLLHIYMDLLQLLTKVQQSISKYK